MASSGVILVVEDDLSLRRLYSDSLTMAGYKVYTACDGIEALDALNTVRPRLVLLDINMPNMNGIETCKRARKIVGDGIPIVFLSNHDKLDILHECVGAGGDDYIVKSDSLYLLLERIRQWMEYSEQNVWESASTRLKTRREKVLSRVVSKTDDGATSCVASMLLSSDSDRSVREMSEFLREARAGTETNFGTTVTEKLYLLGYVAGIVEQWSQQVGSVEDQFNDYLIAVLRETEILTEDEVSEMVSAFDELSVDICFGIARAHGRNDSSQRHRKGDQCIPIGLVEYQSFAAA